MPAPVLDTAVGRPAPQLRAYVARYSGYRYEGFRPGTHQGLPSRHLTFVISLDGPLRLSAMPGPGQAPGSFATAVAGLHSVPATIAHDGDQHGVQLDLTPLGARALLGVPASALAASVVELADLRGTAGAELPERLVLTPGWPGRFAVLDDVLSRLVVEAPEPPREVAWAWHRLVRAGGAIEIAALAAEVGWSRRHLAERFRRELGLSPKTAARVLRFERARRLLGGPVRPALAEVAAECGYFDQAHLNRDWRELAGCTPTAWLAEELPSVQDPAPIEASP